MEAFAFELKLVDSVSAPSEKAAEAVKSIEKSANRTNDALGKQFEKIGFAAARAAKKQQDAFANSFAKIGMAAERAKQRHEKLTERKREKSEEHSLLSGFKEATGLGRLATASFFGDLAAEGVAKIAESMIEGAKAAVEILVDGVKEAFAAAGKEQTFRIGEKLSLGAHGGKEFREDVERFSNITGFNPNEIRSLMLPMRRAGFDQKSSRQAFATAADIAAGQGKGGDAGAVGGILEQFQRLKTKGGIGKKQLVELLGGSGDTIPDFYKALGKTLKVSAKQAEKMAEEGGKIDPQLLMNMITGSVNKKQGGPAGTGAAEYGKSWEATMHKLSGLQDRFFEKIADSPGFKHATEMLSSLFDKLDPEGPTGSRIMASLNRAFEKLTGWIGGPDEAVDGIADSIENIIGLVEELLPDLKEMGSMLLASANTIADVIRGARLFAAIQSGDKAGAAEIMKEQAGAKVERMARKFADENAANDRARAYGGVAANLAMGNFVGAAAAAQPRDVNGKVIHMKVDNHTTINGTDDESLTKAAAVHHQKMVHAHERAAQEGG